jgi:hypothetical protein
MTNMIMREPELPVLEPGDTEVSIQLGAFTSPHHRGLRRIDQDDVVFIPCVVTGEDGPMEIMKEFTSEEVSAIEASVLGQTRFGVEIYRSTLERVNLQRDNTSWGYMFDTNAGTLFR